MKIPFTLEEHLAHPEKKVVTRDGRRVEILSVTCKVRESQPILAQIEGAKKSFTLEYYSKNGTAPDKNYNLFFADEEPELSEFENGLVDFYNKRGALVPDKDGVLNRHELDELLHKTAAELLELAREQILQEQLHSETVLFTKEELFEHDNDLIEIGKAEALKDLPRWKKIKRGERLPCRAYLYELAYEQEGNFYGRATVDGMLMPNEAVKVGCDTWYLSVDDIKNLPKED